MNDAVLQALSSSQTASVDPLVLAALLLKLPQSGDQRVDAMIRTARVLDMAEQLSVAQAADPAAQKDLLRTLQRNFHVATQIQSNLERCSAGDTIRAAA
jgi:hypothetical protein